MLSFVSSFVLNHLDILIGYIICVVVPIPWLSRAILDVWSQVGSKIMSTITNMMSGNTSTTTTTVTPVTTSTVPTTTTTTTIPTTPPTTPTA